MTESNADNNSEEENPYEYGEPVVCDRCGEYVALHYHPQGEFAANYAGFVAHCTCTAGAQLSAGAVEDLAPRWYAEMVMEAEEDGEDWLEYYMHENRDVSRWTGDGDE